MKLNLSEEWYAREFRKDAEEPAMSVAAGCANAHTPPTEEVAAQEDKKRVGKAVSISTPLPPNNVL